MIDEVNDNERTIQDGRASLQKYTNARIGLGRTGISLKLKEVLDFKMAHAHARDAVFSMLNKEKLTDGLYALQLPFILLKSKATDRHIYLQRPDFGRRLDNDSVRALSLLANDKYDIAISLADGLSAEAVNHHAIPVITFILGKLHHKFSIAPVCLIDGGRVAISDETGFLLGAKLSLIFIGERPGLSSPDSLGAYLTYAPQIGLTDERRNCVSNIRPDGLGYKEAAEKIAYLVEEMMRVKLSGVTLKDNSSIGFKEID